MQNGFEYCDNLDGTYSKWSGPEKPSAKQVNPLKDSRVRRFVLRRDEDETGISGTGVVAEGAEFSNGQCVLSWMTVASSLGVYPNIKELERIHGHNGRAVVVYIDPPMGGSV